MLDLGVGELKFAWDRTEFIAGSKFRVKLGGEFWVGFKFRWE